MLYICSTMLYLQDLNKKLLFCIGYIIVQLILFYMNLFATCLDLSLAQQGMGVMIELKKNN